MIFIFYLFRNSMSNEERKKIEEAIDIMPVYEDHAEYTTPVDFIMQYWDYASDGVRLQMMEYIEEHPFAGCERYIEQWNYYLDHNKGRVLPWL